MVLSFLKLIFDVVSGTLLIQTKIFIKILFDTNVNKKMTQCHFFFKLIKNQSFTKRKPVCCNPVSGEDFILEATR